MPKYKVLSEDPNFDDIFATIKLLATADGVSQFVFGFCCLSDGRLHYMWKMMFGGEEYAGAIAVNIDGPETQRERDRRMLLLQAFNAIVAVQKRANGGG